MTWSERTSASRRHGWLVIGVVALGICSASGLRAQGAASQTAATQTAQPPDPLKLDWDTPGMLLFQVDAARVSDFKAAWAGIRAGLAKSTKPGLREFAETLDIFKVQEIGVDTVYVLKFDRPSKQFPYNPIALLYYTDDQAIPRAEADALYKLWDKSAAVQPWKFAKIGG